MPVERLSPALKGEWGVGECDRRYEESSALTKVPRKDWAAWQQAAREDDAVEAAE